MIKRRLQGPMYGDVNARFSTLPDEFGNRTTPGDQVSRLYQQLTPPAGLRETIRVLRQMDDLDPRVKRIHSKVATDVIKGGLLLSQTRTSKSDVIDRAWCEFRRRCQLDRAGKVKSDARAFVLTGNLALQWVLDGTTVARAISMPAETITPQTTPAGVFADVNAAYVQFDGESNLPVAKFPLWKLTHGRLDPVSYDDMGALGRPFLDASRGVWRKLVMTEDDLVVRRRMRAPLRLVHVLENANDAQLEAYRLQTEKKKGEINTDFYLNRKGAVTAIQGDSTLGDIDDVTHLLDTLFSGAPYPKALLGYADGLARDVLEDLKRAYCDELDFLQDEIAWTYDQGFQLHLLLQGIDPLDADYTLKFAERRTETLVQTTDRVLKWQALGVPESMRFEELGLDPQAVAKRREQERDQTDPYPGGPGGDMPAAPGQISITPGNGRKGESGTDVSLPVGRGA